jgi:ABC-type spermidine/putrescine transport system permease subunit I
MVSRAARWIERIAPLVPLAWLVALFLVPLGFTVVYSFAHPEFGGETLGFTLINFRQALSGFYLTIFERTIEFAATGTLLCLLVALPLAYALARKAGRHKTTLLVLLLVPFWTSFLIRTLSWQILLAPGGHVEAILNFLHLHHGQLDILDTQTAVFVGIVYGYLPLAAIPLFVAFERIRPELIEASKDLGGNRIRTFLHVTLRLARPGLATSVLLTFVPMTGEFVIPQILGGDKGVLMGGLISTQYLASANYPLGSAMAVLVLAVLSVAVALFARATRGFAEAPS